MTEVAVGCALDDVTWVKIMVGPKSIEGRSKDGRIYHA